jgi:hypothetical protein
MFVACSSNVQEELSNYQVASYKGIPPMAADGTINLLLAPGGGQEPFVETSYMGHEFKVVVNQAGDTSRFVTHDSTFHTPEGYAVGSFWRDIPLADQTKVKIENGYGYYLKLHSGWTLGFCAGSEYSNEELSEESRVVWIEK